MAFDPASLSGKLLWLRAKDLGANGSVVNAWPDQSGASRDAYQPSAPPTVATASTPLGGKSVRFSGSTFLTFSKYRGIDISAVLASSEFSAQYVATNAIDALPEQNGPTNLWASTTVPAWIRLQPTVTTVVTSYGILARTTSINQSPKDWTFQGSNDGSAWTTLDTQTGIIFASEEAKTFSFSNATAYTYYRLNVTAVNGSTLVAIADVSLNPLAGYGMNNPVTASTTAAEVWLVVKADTGAARGLWSFGSDTGGLSDSYYPYSDGRVYESFGTTSGNRQSFTPTEPTSSWQIYRVRNDGATWQAWTSGNTQFTASSKPFGYSPLQMIGRTRTGGGLGAFFAGNIAEVYMRNQISTTQEASDLYNYFLTEHISATGIATAQAENIYTETIASGTASIQTEVVYAEAIASSAGFGIQTESVYTESLTTAPKGIQTESLYFETLMPVQPVQVESVYAETALTGTPPSRIEAVYTEVVLLSAPPSQVENVYMELVLLALPATRFVGWGSPR